MFDVARSRLSENMKPETRNVKRPRTNRSGRVTLHA
jgi:hypothetical protein